MSSIEAKLRQGVARGRDRSGSQEGDHPPNLSSLFPDLIEDQPVDLIEGACP